MQFLFFCETSPTEMNDNPTPEDSGKPWNSHEIAVGQMTCNQLARFSTAFIGALRMFRGDHKLGGTLKVMKAIAILLDNHIAILEAPDFPNQEMVKSEIELQVSLNAMLMAGLCTSDGIDPRHACAIAISLIEACNELKNHTGPAGEDDLVVVDIRKREKKGFDDPPDGAASFEMGLRLEPTPSDIQTDQSKLGRLIRRVVNKSFDKNK